MQIPSASRWARLKATLDVVLDAPSSQMSRLLRQTVPVDGSLYAAARTLLRRKTEAERFLDSRPVPSPPRLHPASSLSTGTMVAGRYRVVRLLGAGGMGEVYECFDDQLAQTVAVKILKPDFAEDGEFLHRFREELALGRQVHHRNVCRLYELHSWDRPQAGGVFFTMELLEGETLEDRLRRGPLTEDEARPLALQILGGMGAMHDTGILHRDLKCSNIMLVGGAEESAPRAVVMDFGLARRFDSGERTLAAIADGGFAGTPAYMPPEQLEGQALTAASDIHAFGVVLFKMVTGRLPFSADTDLQIAVRRLSTAAPSVHRYAPAISRSLGRVIAACLQAKPLRRPQQAATVIEQLEGRQSARAIGRSIAYAGLAVVLAAAVAVGVNMASRSAAAPQPDALRHYQLGQEFVDRRSGDDLRQAVAEFERAIRFDPSYAPAYVGLAETYSGLANWGLMEAVPALNQAREAATRALQLDPRLASAHGILGYTLSIDVTQWHDATPHFERALALDAKDVKVHLWYGAHLGRLGQHPRALEQIRLGLQSKPADMLLNHQLASEYFRGREYAAFYDQAQELVRLQPFQANSHLVRARALEALGRYDEALDACRAAEKYGVDRGQLVLMLGLIEAARGNTAAAQTYAEEAEQLPRARPVDVAALYVRLGRFDAAVERLESGLKSRDSSVLVAHVTPYFDPMREHDRYLRFLRTIGAPR